MALSIDVTGLPDEAVATVQHLVSELVKRSTPQSGLPAQFASREEWQRAVREWTSSHATAEALVDWSRESAYAGCGE